MKCNHYSLEGQDFEFLAYGDKFDFPEGMKCISEDVDPSLEQYRKLDLVRAETLFNFGRTRDRILEEHHIKSFYDLTNAYTLLRLKILMKPRKVREFVEEKYIEVIDLVHETKSNPETDTKLGNEDNQ